MRFNRRPIAVCLAIILACCGISLFYSLLGAGGDVAALNGQQPGDDPSLRLESWGECFQSSPALFLAAASLQADHVGRSGLRDAWQRRRIGLTTAQLVFFLRYAETANRPATIDEFHTNQDLMVNSRLPRQDDLAMLQAAAAWFVDRCPRTPWMVFAEHGAAVNPLLVALHAAGNLSVTLTTLAVHPLGNASFGGAGRGAPRCLLLDRQAAELVPRWPTTWPELLSVKGFSASAREATRLFCSTGAQPSH